MTFSIDLNWAAHHKVITVKAYQTLGLIRRTFKTGCSTEAKKKLYIALVRSQLIYCSQLWRPQLIKDITALERIQRRPTKYILNDYNQEFIIKREGRVSNAILHEQNTLRQVIASSSGYFSIISVNFNTWLCRKELVDRR